MNNKNYRVMKFFELVDKKDKAKGYVRLDIRGVKGNVIISVENLGDVKSTSEVYLYKDKVNKIKLGDINNKKGMLKKILTFGSNSDIEDYNVCAVVKNGKIALYSNLFNATSLENIKKLNDSDDDLNFQLDRIDESEKALELEKPQQAKKTIIENEKNYADEEVEKEEAPVKKIIEATEETTEEDVSIESQKSKNNFHENLFNNLKNYREVEPLSVKIKDFRWWYIPYDELGMKNGFLPYYNQIISSYYPYPMSNRVTTCNGLMRKYGHYIFGIYKENDDIEKFIYGVPGGFTKEEQPYKGITGFKNWSYGNKENKKEHGYWLAFVNPNSGETMDPPQIVLSK